ncbi:MAG TPA: translation elongation factor 4 [Spirochaetota bacterium]|nr:translation elongation factor 4 [Spirochaetota bacterium]HOM38412.1 translation elongation factor 4 [Spirochaetota bacterium]HPQ48951.1 translation elongation factor 4 [Spirochaetota bacterium]
MIDKEFIRNFSIIAHIDHGKSTLADRLIEITKAIDDRKKKDQILDTMDIERERGITIKAQTIKLEYNYNGKLYELNLIDTPGHVDFSYEVSRALMACEGVLLLVDASQGIEAQTLAHFYSALEHNLEIVPVVNKIDLPNADIERTLNQIERELALDRKDAVLVSAKKGIGIDALMKAIIEKIPAPKGDINNPLKALVYDAYYDDYRGVVVLIRVFDGIITKGMKIRFMQTGFEHEVEEVGFLRIGNIPTNDLSSGEVGYLIANIKSLENVKIGDTITSVDNPATEPVPGFRDVKSFVFASVYPSDSTEYSKLKESLQKLKINDAALTFEPETSIALGAGFRCGFLGLLHFEIIQERLSREFDLNVIVTTPTVEYKVLLKNGEEILVESPIKFPDPSKIEKIYEPLSRVTIFSPKDYIGNVITLCQEKRGVQEHMHYIDDKMVELIYTIPLAEVIYDFHDKIKSISKGYATFDYDITDFQESDIVKVDIYINKNKVDAFSFLTHSSTAYQKSKAIVEKLKEMIPKHLFKIPIQASIGSKVIAREDISALRKDVTAKCYGGDITRKRKLLEKQKEGKKKMQMIGKVEIPQEAFLSVFKADMNQ